jgi:[ribosomal protein S18]-alanine N-acetyltransferase
MLELVIHRASPPEARVMAVLHASSFAKPWDEAAMGEFIAAPDTLCLIGTAVDSSGGLPSGLLIARRAADEAELLTLAVAPNFRRAGLGKALLEEAIAVLRAAGAKQLFLEVAEGNQAAIGLYRSIGAKPVGKRSRYYDDGADAAIFSLALCPSAADDGASEREA